MEEISESTKQKGMEIFRQKKVIKEVETDRRIHFKVIGETEEHSVIFDKEKNSWECDCKYSTLKQKECSHIIATKLFMKNNYYFSRA